MGRIQRLSPLEAQKIAAGQVVERPCNVVKELVENAYDAGATQIDLEFDDAGKKRICIVDNGSGMSAEDARFSIEKHATSKITSVDDLAHITTFGFRGEALASIAAVSHMKLITRETDQLHALQITVADGSIVHETLCAHNAGTSIEVRDLFYNMPARQKFLKRRETEWNQIHHFLQAFCLSHCMVAVTVTHDKHRVMHCPITQSLRDRCAHIWGRPIVHELIDLPDTQASNGLSISGIVSNHQHARYDRSGIFFFVNNRWVQNTALARSLLKAYQNVLPAGRYPIGCIFITIDQREIDINIHPKKEEITFLHPRIVETLIQDTVKKALEQNLTGLVKKSVHLTSGLLPDGTIQRMHSFAPHQAPAWYIQNQRLSNESPVFRSVSDDIASTKGGELTSLEQIPVFQIDQYGQLIESSVCTPRVIPVETGIQSSLIHAFQLGKLRRAGHLRNFSTACHTQQSLSLTENHFEEQSHSNTISSEQKEWQTQSPNKQQEPPYTQEQLYAQAQSHVQSTMLDVEYASTIIGQYAKTYILVERADGLWMVDQHAAHERVLYEAFSQSQHAPATVQLIVPHVVTLARDQLAQLEPHLDILRSNGFGVDVCGFDQLAISITPVHAKNMPLDELVRQCVSWIHEYQSYTAEEFSKVINHHMRAQMACKAAVKAGDELSQQEMVDILEKLEQAPNKLTCPHGRPTGWLMSLYEIEKKFKRKV